MNYDHKAFFSNILLLKTYAVLPFGSSDCQAKTVMLRVPTTSTRSLGVGLRLEILLHYIHHTVSSRFQCPSAGLFQCSITGLVFRMEGEGEMLYRTVHWDRRLLSQSGKRPAGPLFMFRCLKGSVSQLHLPHCQMHSGKYSYQETFRSERVISISKPL